MIDDELNHEQVSAVYHVDGPLLVLAGAGSGKTRVVTYRIANLLKSGVLPKQIVALTFTNKAAEEMRSRVQRLTNQKILATTFHSLGAQILRESIHLLDFPSTFTIFDEKDSMAILKSCLPNVEKNVIKDLRYAISDAKNNLLAPDDFKNDKAFCEVYTNYQAKLKENQALDFDDLLFFTVEVLKHKDSPYQDRWKYVLVDEYQDTNHAQYTMCKLLTKNHGNLFVVGDPDQSIYSWRGANVSNILRFETDFPGAKVVPLMQNYRTTNTILQAANAVISKNNRIYEKKLWSALGDGEKISLHNLDSDLDEARFVTKEIKEVLKKYKPEEIAIFYRTNSQSRSLEDQLLINKIPYTIVGGLSFYARKEIKDVLSFLRLVIIPSDTISFERTINLPKRGIGKKAIEKLLAFAKEKNKPIIETLELFLHEFPKKQQSAIYEYLSILNGAKKGIQERLPLHEVIQKVIELSQYEAYLKEDKESFEDKKENIEELVAKAYQWEKSSEEPTLQRFLEDLTLNVPRELEEMQTGGVRLMTVHNAKGLEFTCVFMVGLEENLFPHINSKLSEQDLEEERRLFYVGMTRAKRHLHLLFAKRRFLFTGAQTMYPSRFLKEIPTEFIKRSNFSYTEVEATPHLDNTSFEVGAIVLHRDFGRGVVVKSYETAFGLTYDVDFQSDKSRKSLVAKFAKLSSE